jgi:hypothetical protein
MYDWDAKIAKKFSLKVCGNKNLFLLFLLMIGVSSVSCGARYILTWGGTIAYTKKTDKNDVDKPLTAPYLAHPQH